jgi:hypothetical protein
MADEKTPEPSKTKEQLLVEAQALAKEEETRFIEEYNALCARYGLQIQPQMTLVVTRTK